MTRSRPIIFLLGAAPVGVIALAVAGCGGRGKGDEEAQEERKVNVTPRITFTPTGGDPSTQSRGLGVKRP
jgi:hypothetical protein